MVSLETFQEAIRDESLHGWLFCNMHHRDLLADRLLDIPREAMNSRQWFYFIPAEGEPTKIVHAVEETALHHLPGRETRYGSREELMQALAALPKGKVGAQFSQNLTAISYLDYGTALLLQEAGFTLVSSADLIQKTVGVLTDREIESHERAAAHLYEIIGKTWEACKAWIYDGRSLFEGDLQEWIYQEFEARALTTDHPPIVAAGQHSANPHYMVEGRGSPISDGDIIQFDIFAREQPQGSIFADISWTAFCDQAVPSSISRVFQAVQGARDSAVQLITERLGSNTPVRGDEVDTHVRTLLEELGLGSYLRHRTGHSIDTEIHGSGANLDSVEFPDSRELIEGSCFSIEPGVYLETFGIRTEIDVYIKNGTVVISGGSPQQQVLTL
jgi:Xaa-Pro aminopeptidase